MLDKTTSAKIDELLKYFVVSEKLGLPVPEGYKEMGDNQLREQIDLSNRAIRDILEE